MRHLKFIILGLGLLVVSCLAFSGVTSAQTVKMSDSVTVPAGETVDSVLFASGTSVDIAGTVNGDVFCAGQNITISGTVNGDVFCAGQTITISGKVEGGVRLASQTITLGGVITGDATVASQTLLFEKGSIIGRDFVGGVQNATINGVVGRDLAIGAQSLTVNGEVGRNVKGGVETLTVGSTGLIKGDVAYSSNNSPVVSTGGKINGTVTRTPVEKQQSNTPDPFAATVVSLLYTFVTILILGFAVALMFPRVLDGASSRALKAPGRTVLIGFASIILVPALIILLLISIIGSPLGLLVLFAWFVVVLLTGPFAGYVLGRLVLKDANKPIMTMLLGLSILLILSFIPIFGFFVILAIYVYGVGVLLPELTIRFRQPALKK